MPQTKLANALKAVDWQKNVSDFLAQPALTEKLALANYRTAIWAHELELIESDNPALTFVREMQVSGQNVCALLALAMYKAAASSTRTLLESCLYYTYFRTHPEELATLVRDKTYYIDKRFVIEYHTIHTPRFKKRQAALGLVGNLNAWYSDVSAIIHGQIPGSWIGASSLADTATDPEILKKAADTFCKGEELAHHLLLCTVGETLWDGFNHASKGALLKGLSGDKKAALELDGA